jgi:hypothetical protein
MSDKLHREAPAVFVPVQPAPKPPRHRDEEWCEQQQEVSRRTPRAQVRMQALPRVPVITVAAKATQGQTPVCGPSHGQHIHVPVFVWRRMRGKGWEKGLGIPGGEAYWELQQGGGGGARGTWASRTQVNGLGEHTCPHAGPDDCIVAEGRGSAP